MRRSKRLIGLFLALLFLAVNILPVLAAENLQFSTEEQEAFSDFDVTFDEEPEEQEESAVVFDEESEEAEISF